MDSGSFHSQEVGLATTWQEIAPIFSPDRAISEPSKLYARSDELERLLRAYSSQDSIPLITGPPGVGKTSLLAVFGGILTGHYWEIEGVDLGFNGPPEVNRLVVWTQCSPEMVDADALAQHIMGWFRYLIDTAPERKRFQASEFTIESHLPFADLGATWERVASVEQTPLEQLASLTIIDGEVNDREIVFVLDECEHLPWLPNLFGFIRHFDQYGVRFLLGVRDHVVPILRGGVFGTYRAPVEIGVSRFSRGDILDFFNGVSADLQEVGVDWLIDPPVIDRIVDASAGEPWYLQMIALELVQAKAVDLAAQARTTETIVIRCTVDDFDAAQAAMMRSRLTGMHRSSYESLVERAPRREEVIQCLAMFPETIIPRAFVQEMNRRRGLRADSAIRYLKAVEPEPILVDSPSMVGGLEFANHQFRVYCRLGRLVDESSRVLARNLVSGYRYH